MNHFEPNSTIKSTAPTILSPSIGSGAVATKRGWDTSRIYSNATQASNRFFGWIGIRGKLLLLILGVIASVSLLGSIAYRSTIDFFETREKVDLKDESSITRLRLELMLAETEIQARNSIASEVPRPFGSSVQDGENPIPVPVQYSFSPDGLKTWHCWFPSDDQKKFIEPKVGEKQQSGEELRPEVRRKFTDRMGGERNAEHSDAIWSGVYWDGKGDGRSARIQLLLSTRDEKKQTTGYWLVVLDLSKALEKILTRSPREYVFLINPGPKKELTYSPFGDPTVVPFRARGKKPGSARDDASDLLNLKTGKELKNAIAAYEERVQIDDIDSAATTRRAGLEYPLELEDKPNGSKFTLSDLLSHESDLPFLGTAWYCDTGTIEPATVRELGHQKILEPTDLVASPYDPMKRMSESTGQTRKLSIRAGTKEELNRLKTRISSRLFDIMGKSVDLKWKTAKQMDGLVLNVSAVHGSKSKMTDEPAMYFVRAVALKEIRESADESLASYVQWAYILAVAAVVIVIMLAIYIAQPLVKMTETVNEISQVGISDAIGSDKIRKLLDQLPVDKQGEVGSLAIQFKKTFHEMLNQLRFKVNAEKEIMTKGEEANRYKQKERDAIEESQAKSQFLAMISHDMRQPLHMIFTELQLMMKQNLNTLQTTKANAILSSARRLKNLIQDILDYQRYMANDLAIERVEVSVQSLLRGIEEQFSHAAQETENKLVVVCEFERTIYTDQAKLERILVNLLSNAFKFTEKGTITLQADLLRGNLIQFVVRDTGRGISEEKKEKIFSIQRTANQKGNPGGTGLGLYICNLLIQHMKGDIQFESKVGVGTTFTITIPTDFIDVPKSTSNADLNVKSPAGLGTTLAEVTAKGPREKRITVLIIDDQAESRRSIRESLPSTFDAIEASSGQEGIRLAKQYVPDAITLDVEMPEMDGWQVLTELQKDDVTQGIPVVMVTVHPTQNKATILGANGFISKPFDPIELSSMIRRTLIEQVDGTVMIVDDDAGTRRDLKQYLESSGWKVVVAVDGEDAMNLLQSNLPSLFIVDLYMPNMDGFALIEKLRAMPDTANIPIVVLSAAYLSPEQRSFLQPRIQQYFGKGTSDLNAIQDEIERLVSRGGVVQSALDRN